MCFFGFGRFLPQFRGGALGGKFATFALFFTTPAPKAAQRDPGAPPASKCSQNDPKWSPKCSKMLSCWTPFGFIFRNVVSSSFAQRKAQKKNRRAFRPLFCEESRTLRWQSTSPTHCGSAPRKKMASVSPSFSARKGSSPQAEYQTGLLCFAGRRSQVVGRWSQVAAERNR
jgi:hypothetical protein